MIKCCVCGRVLCADESYVSTTGTICFGVGMCVECAEGQLYLFTKEELDACCC